MLIVYHGTEAKNLAGIKKDGLTPPPRTGPKWFMVTDNFKWAAFHTRGDADSIVIKYVLPDKEASFRTSTYLWKDFPASDTFGGGKQYALKKPIPGKFITDVETDVRRPVESRDRRPRKTPTASIVGNRSKASGPDPKRVFEFRYKVVELSSLQASHDEALAVNPNFPKELQPRIRGREASRQQVLLIAKNLQPDALIDDLKTLDRGPMIVGPDNVVESGNGRTIALTIARLEFPTQWAAYEKAVRERAAEFGIESTAGIKDCPKCGTNLKLIFTDRGAGPGMMAIKMKCQGCKHEGPVVECRMADKPEGMKEARRLWDEMVKGNVTPEGERSIFSDVDEGPIPGQDEAQPEEEES